MIFLAPTRLLHLVAAILAFALCASACSGSSADSTADVQLEPAPEPSVQLEAEEVQDEEVASRPAFVDAVAVDLSSFPEPRYPSFEVPRSAEHQAAGIAAGESVSADAIVAVLGYSTTNMIFRQYENAVETDFKLVNAALPGMDIERWASREVAFPRAIETIQEATGSADPDIAERVEVLIVQIAIAGTDTERVEYVRSLINETIRVSRIHFPNVKQVYLVGREFGGWSKQDAPDGSVFAGEPGNWALSIAIDRAVADNAGRPDGVWVGAGPYMWANGDTPRADGLTWSEELFKEDGRHLRDPAAKNAALMIHEFFLNDETAPWYEARVVEQ